MTISDTKRNMIQKIFEKIGTIQGVCNELQLNYRTVAKYLKNKPQQRKCNPQNVIKIYELTGSLKRTAKILNISSTTVWRNLKSQNVIVGNGSKNWKRLYLTLRGRVSKSQWRKDILKKCDYKCSSCKEPSNIVHHIKKLSDLRDEIIKNYPNINPFSSFKELRQFTDLVMNLHHQDDGVVLCRDCHEKEHSH